MMKKSLVYRWSLMALPALVLLVSSCSNHPNSGEFTTKGTQVNQKEVASTHSREVTDIKPIYLTTAEFKSKVWDYDTEPQAWNYKGELPCVIDFYADWCKPCKIVAPIMDDLADHYKGRVIIYKVNTDNERELASVFQINSIPSILFSPKDGKPAIQPGALSKEDYIRIIDEFVLKINNKKS